MDEVCLHHGSSVERSKILTDDHLGREAHKAAWGQWLSSEWDWDWWVTLTYDAKKFRPGSPDHTAVGWARSETDWNKWLDDTVNEAALQGDALNPPYWFRGREPNPYRYGTHFHALVGGVRTLSRSRAWSRWFTEHGHARIEPYDPLKGAGFYVAKYVTKELGDLTFSPNAGLHRREARTDDRAADRQRQEQSARNLHPWHVAGTTAGTDVHEGHDG